MTLATITSLVARAGRSAAAAVAARPRSARGAAALARSPAPQGAPPAAERLVVAAAAGGRAGRSQPSFAAGRGLARRGLAAATLPGAPPERWGAGGRRMRRRARPRRAAGAAPLPPKDARLVFRRDHPHPPSALGPPPTTRADAPTGLPGPLAGGADHAAGDRAALARELHTVTVAIAANAAIFVAKLGAYFATGSRWGGREGRQFFLPLFRRAPPTLDAPPPRPRSAMLAEVVHSVVDTANQALLRVGVVRSRRAPTAAHPYG